jgi:hypothetical protein
MIRRSYFKPFQSWQPITRMNPSSEISIREVSRFDTPENSPAFSFTGTRAALAAYLIEKDSAEWNCVDYFILDSNPGSRCDPAIRHWYVWRR